MREKTNHAFTTVELVVAMTVIAILMSLALIALQGSRESSRRLFCASNCRQLGLATQVFSSREMMALPNISGSHGKPSKVIGSIWYQIRKELELPELRKVHYIRRLDDDTPFLGREHHSILNCPSDPVYGGISYRGNTGSHHHMAKAYLLESEQRLLGPFEQARFVRLAECTDGLSNTSLASEKCKGAKDGQVSHNEMWGSGIGGSDLTVPLETMVKLASATPASVLHMYENTGMSWIHPGHLYTSYNHVVAPNQATLQDVTPTKSNSLFADKNLIEGIVKASSYHPGGIHMLRLDGAVSFISDSVDIDIWRALGTRAGAD